MKTTCAAAMVLAALTLGGCMTHKDSEADEVKVPMEQVPAAVKATLAKEAPGVTIATVDMEKDEGKTIYEADAMIDGKNYEIKVAADGSLVSKKLDDEEKEGKEKDSEKK